MPAGKALLKKKRVGGFAYDLANVKLSQKKVETPSSERNIITRGETPGSR